MEAAKEVIPEVVADFNRIFGRNYSPFLQHYMTDDADTVFFGQGAHVVPARLAVERLRKEGLKVGVVQLRFMRPFPTQEVAEQLSRFKVIGVLENSNSFGSAHNAGPLTIETLAALYRADERPTVLTFMAGLGGENILLKDYFDMAKAMQEAQQMDKLSNRVFWLGFEALHGKALAGE